MPGIELRRGKFYLAGRTDAVSKEHVIEALRQLEEEVARLRQIIRRDKSCTASLDIFGRCSVCGFVSSGEIYVARRNEAQLAGTEGA